MLTTSAWIRVLVCSGPRQVINAFTLKSVYEAKFLVDSDNFEDSFVGFFKKIGELYEKDYRQALILSGMCFTLVIWVFSALFLLAAIFFYVFFLFHWLPSADGGLAGYCERKVTKALLRIVTEKVNKALAKGQHDRFRAEGKAIKKGEKPQLDRAATLPTLPDVGPVKDDSLPVMPMLGRNETMTTLPAYTSRPPSPGHIELSNMDRKRPLPSRNGTGTSYSSNAPLIGGAADMGYDRSNSPAPTVPDLDMGMYAPPHRPGTSNSQRSFGPQMGHMNSNSSSSLRTPITESPGGMSNNPMPPFGGPPRTRTMDSYGQGRDQSSRASPAPPRPHDGYNPGGRSSPAPSRPYEAYDSQGRSTPDAFNAYRGGQPTPRPQEYANQQPYQPSRGVTGPVPGRNPQYAPQRNMTAPMPPRAPGANYSERPSTPQSMRGPPQNYNGPGTPQGQRGPPRGAPYGYDVESQGGRGY